MPQDIQTVFLRNTVREEMEDAGVDLNSLPYDLTPLLNMHPYDLSGGEQQLAALAKVLALKPKILLLDEPTKGLDAASKGSIRELLRKLTASGITIVTVTHDVEFAAECADRCAMFFRGEIISIAEPEEFFSANSFYTTAASRITRGHFERAVTSARTAELCRLNGRKAEM
jgi:energy-coupling factor transport system ATP-binding protein